MHIPVVIVGAGHSGLAMSACLTARGIDHVILERGEVAHSWRTQRWDSLRLLTPNWQTRLPGHAYEGDDPDGFMTVPELVDFISDYAGRLDAPVRTGTTVTSVRQLDAGFEIVTAEDTSTCDAVVLATGACNVAAIPELADGVPAAVHQVDPLRYRNPDELPPGGVLVVGASATGLQLADEIHDSRRPVTLAVGEHVRLPRTYRGRDIYRWMDLIGRLDERYDEVDDILRARKVPSPQIAGTPERRELDLNSLTERGVRLVGRLAAITDGRAQFSGSLRNQCSLADLKMGRLLQMIDEWVTEQGLDESTPPPHRFEATRVGDDPPLGLDLTDGSIASIVWATGFRPDYSWLDIPVLDGRGRIRHDGGVVTDAPGLYVMGLNFLRRRRSTFINGADADANDLADHLAAHLGERLASA